VRKIKLFTYSFIIILAVLAAAGCTLPDFTFSSRAPAVSIPPAAPPVVVNPSPINPDFTPTPAAPAATTPVSLALPDYVSVIAKVRPSVAIIHTETPSFDVFNGTTTQKGAGSGWIIDSSGLIVTNNHVVQGANTVTVVLDDGRKFTADTVRSDPATDLAVIKINAPNLTALTVADSTRLKVGDLVVAIGNSLDEGISATNGIISATGVSITTETGETLYDLIKTNAAINPGNSGGPLVNMEGKVIGITGAKVAQVGVEGTGYAISSSVAMPIINDLIKVGFVSRPWLGVSLYTVDASVVQSLRLKVNKGVLLRQVIAGGPADKAGLKRYDVITNFDGQDVASQQELIKIIRAHKVGQTVPVVYWRGSNQSTSSLTLEQSPPPS
jgi:serine protease Do